MEADTIVLIVTIVGSVLGSTLTSISLLLGQVNRLDGRLNVMGRDVVDMGDRLARIEGCLMAPEGFKGRDLRPPASDEDSPEDPVS